MLLRTFGSSLRRFPVGCRNQGRSKAAQDIEKEFLDASFVDLWGTEQQVPNIPSAVNGKTKRNST